MTDDLRFFLEDLNDNHAMRKMAFIKYVLEGNTIDENELMEFGLNDEEIAYVCLIYDWVSVTEGVINNKY